MLERTNPDNQQILPQEYDRLLIDGDGIIYIVAWEFRDHIDEVQRPAIYPLVVEKVRDVLRGMCSYGVNHYVGFIGPESSALNFRKTVYRYQPYKGKRPPDPEWVRFWKPDIRRILVENFGFHISPAEIETDDCVALLSEKWPSAVVCSPDKDLKQLATLVFDPKTTTFYNIGAEKAEYNWCIQMLMGDDTDNIAGIPGTGPKRAVEILLSVDRFERKTAVLRAYEKYFGPYYGNIIHSETYMTVSLLTSGHHFYYQLAKQRDKVLAIDTVCTMPL